MHQHGRVCSAPVIPKRTAQRVGQTRHICPVRKRHQHGRVCSAPVIPKRTAQRVGQTRYIGPVRKMHQHGRVCSAPVIPKRTAQGVGQTRYICPRLADQAKHCTKRYQHEVPTRDPRWHTKRCTRNTSRATHTDYRTHTHTHSTYITARTIQAEHRTARTHAKCSKQAPVLTLAVHPVQ